MADLNLQTQNPKRINTLKNQYKNKSAAQVERRSGVLRILSCLAVAGLIGATGRIYAASDSKEDVAAQQSKQIAILKSSAPPQDKALACKRLAIYGSKDAVPALAS